MMASDADMILRISCLYLKQRQDADDICQDVFLKLMLLDSDVVVGKPPIDFMKAGLPRYKKLYII